VTELPAEELAAALQALDAAEMARQTALYPVAEYMFKHPLTHEVALDSQLREARSRRHLAVARALEERHADKLDENAALLAYHFDEAGEVLDAARWHVRAAQWISYNDVVEALRHWTRVPELAGELPGADAADLCVFASQRILLLQGNLGIERAQADALLERGRRLAGRSRDTEATAKLLTSYGLAIGLTGAMPDAHAAMEESLVLTRDDPGSDQHLDTGQMACWVLHSLGRLHEADARFRVILAANSEGTSALFDTPIHSSASLLGGWLLLERGRLDEAGSLFTRLWSEGMGRLNALLIACIHGFDARRLAHQGDLDRALRMASDGIELAEKSRNPNALSVVYQVLGEVQNLRGDFSGGRESLQEGLRVARESGTMLNLEARTVLELARSHLGLGEHERALEVADEAISVAQLRSARHHEGLANVVRAEVLLGAYSPDRADEIEALLKRAADLIEESGYGLAERDLERARAALSRARGTGQAAPGR
jgi:adenylate cyclase